MMWILSNIKLIGFGLIIACIPMAYIVGTYSGKAKAKADYALAEAAHKEASRGVIIETEKKYGKIKNAIIRTDSPNAVVGSRVALAIDSMP